MSQSMTRGTIDVRSINLSQGRVIGDVDGAHSGPILLCIASMHGNEPSGVLALQRVFAALGEHQPSMRGRLVGLVGNLSALSAGVRFVDRDLNRIWSPRDLDAVRSDEANDSEADEQRDLLSHIDPLFATGRDIFFLDLHTTSADGAPFALMGDTLRNRAFSRCFPVPVILGLEEQLSGTVTEYVNERGAVTVGFEAGRHDDLVSVDRHEAAIWMALRGTSILRSGSMPHVKRSADLLEDSAAGLSRILEVRYRHAVRSHDEFEMMPGYETFQPVRMGEILGRDRHGPVAAPVDGQIILPLYQRQGSDGFFLARPVRRFWLTLSALLRRLRADYLLPLLPGIVRHPEQSGVLLANPRIARFLTNEIFHLFGFRRCTPEEGRLVYKRRTHDFDGR
ncbi:MAG: succinylglutamate desuccinylase/aspartoacylase family protein [Phycisphaerae bacterium]